MAATQNRPEPPGPDATQTRPGGGSGWPDGRGPGPWGKVPRSRMGGVWVALVVAAFVFLLLLIFILQNGQRAQVSFLGAHGHLPMGVGLLLAALPGTARIIQLRMLGRRRGARVEPEPPPAAAGPDDSVGL